MKNTLAILFIALVVTSCGDASKPQDAGTPGLDTASARQANLPPPALAAEFDNIQNELQQHIEKDFWSQFTSTTHRGGKGTTEITFDANALDAFMEKKGFVKEEKKMMEYHTTVHEITVTLRNTGATSGEKGGWVQNWEIETKAPHGSDEFKSVRTFATQQ